MNINSIILPLVLLSLLGLLFYFLVSTCEPKKESWVDYQQLPFGNVQSGAGNYDTQPVFYEYPVFRKPLNYPVCHLVDYPVPHCRTDSL